jgi:hypothetical protein
MRCIANSARVCAVCARFSHSKLSSRVLVGTGFGPGLTSGLVGDAVELRAIIAHEEQHDCDGQGRAFCRPSLAGARAGAEQLAGLFLC